MKIIMQECKESEIFDFLEKTECNAMDHYEKPEYRIISSILFFLCPSNEFSIAFCYL